MAAAKDDLIVTSPPGYALRLDPDGLDAARFERQAAAGRRVLEDGQPADAAEGLAAALGLWRGNAPALRAEGRRLERLRQAAVEDRIDAELAIGMGGPLIPELEGLVVRHPGRERPRGQLMRALYQAGRQADALEAFQRARRRLLEESGLEPSPGLKRLDLARPRPSTAGLDR